MARYVLYQAPDVAGTRKALRVPTYWPTGRRLCVVFNESTRGRVSIMELGTLQSFRTKITEVEGLDTLGLYQIRDPWGLLNDKVEAWKRCDRPFSRNKAKQALSELAAQTDT